MMTPPKIITDGIFGYIRNANQILIASHEEPDGDSIGSQLALRRMVRGLGRKATIVNQGKIPLKYKFLPDIEHILDIAEYSSSLDFDVVVVLECPNPARMGRVAELMREDAIIINIDHHPDNTPFGRINWCQVEASSVGEMLTELFGAAKIEIDREMAMQLYAAILTDTGRFRYNSTTRRTMEIAGQLIESGADPRLICDQVYYSLPLTTLKLTGEVLNGIAFYEEGKICLLKLDRRTLESSRADLSESDGLTDYSLHGRGVLVGGLLKEIDSHLTKVSLRSRDGLDVSRLAHKYGGGGHLNASGFTINLPLGQAQDKLLADLKELINGTI